MDTIVSRPESSAPTEAEYPVAVIGDVHGQFDLLEGLLARLDREAPDHTLVFLGDFVDRGPRVKEVVERVAGLVAVGRATAVMGNHDLALVRAAGLDGKPRSPWWADRYREQYQCEPTLASYHGRRSSFGSLANDLAYVGAAMPAEHRAFLAGLPWLVTTPPDPAGGHLFLHCGLSRNLDLSAVQQVGALHRKCWDVWMARSGTAYFARANPEYPPWLGADRTACADPLPLAGWCQVTGHETVEAAHPLEGGHAIRIDTSGGVYEPLTACLIDGPASGWKFVTYPERPRPRGWAW